MLKDTPGTADQREAALEADRLCLLAEQSRASLAMAVFLLAVVGYIFRQQLGAWHVASGLSIMVVYSLRLLLSQRFLALENNRKNQSSWERFFFLAAALSGLSWGIFTMLLISLRSPESDLMGMFLVVGLTAGAIPSLGALTRAYIAYVFMILGPGIAALSLRGDQIGFAFAILALGYVAFLLFSADNFRKRLDIWLQHARENVRLTHNSRHDDLTGLLNKAQFEAELETILRPGEDAADGFALLYVDLDQFKLVNDTCGHATGDLLLQQVAEFLRRHIRTRDLLARLGGDEFGIVLHDCDLEQARQTATVICRGLKQHPFYARERSFRLSVSVGLAVTDKILDSKQELLRAAEAAAYAAKECGRDRVHVYHQHDDLLFRRKREMQWAMEIPEALSEGRFYLDAQAIVPVANPDERGSWRELLLRMRDRDGNTVMPGEFLPAAERYNLAVRLDLWVIETLLECLVRREDLRQGTELCFINLSGQSMGDPQFMEKVCQLLRDSGLPGSLLCFEITETAAVDNYQQALELMQRLKDFGCHFALDDFGSGLSSFGYLRDFPVDFIKIDGAFVRDITQDPVNRSIVASICQIGHTSNRRIIAEFVETEAILEQLREIGVDYAQGFAIEKPAVFAPADAAGALRLVSA